MNEEEQMNEEERSERSDSNQSNSPDGSGSFHSQDVRYNKFYKIAYYLLKFYNFYCEVELCYQILSKIYFFIESFIYPYGTDVAELKIRRFIMECLSHHLIYNASTGYIDCYLPPRGSRNIGVQVYNGFVVFDHCKDIMTPPAWVKNNI
jgi:hypothetical protein